MTERAAHDTQGSAGHAGAGGPATGQAEHEAVVRALADPAAWAAPVWAERIGPLAGPQAIETIETHAALVFLVGALAFKLRKPVRFPFLDYGTRAARHAAAEAELALGRRSAGPLYVGLAPVTREADGRIVVGGSGEALETMVAMQRFDQDALFDRMAARGALTPALLDALADAVVALHRSAPPRPDQGGHQAMAWVVADNLTTLRQLPEGWIDPGELSALGQATETALQAVGGLLERRRRLNLVRHLHGDLHLRNICLFHGRPTLFDAIEFNDSIACTDLLYDLAFLLMDLTHRGLGEPANRVCNRYLERIEAPEGPVLEGLAALPLFLACRATVRAKVEALALPETIRPDAPELDAPRAYVATARAALRPSPPHLIAVGGLSGTGKTTLARGLAPALGAVPGAVILRSDVMRKRLAGVPPEARLPPTAYTAAAAAAVYGVLGREAARILAAGRSVVVDAVFARPEERAAVAAVAAAAGAGFTGLWLTAPHAVLAERIRARRGDASDATESVLRHQLDYELGRIDWHRMAAGGEPATVLARARAALPPTLATA